MFDSISGWFLDLIAGRTLFKKVIGSVLRRVLGYLGVYLAALEIDPAVVDAFLSSTEALIAVGVPLLGELAWSFYEKWKKVEPKA